MKKRKSSFTLIEVLIAIALATTACIFFLQFEQSYVKQARESLLMVQQERRMQEACVELFESLYMNRIDWKAIQDKQSSQFALSDPAWKAIVDFEPKGKETTMTPDVMDVKVTLTLFYNDREMKEKPTFRLCLKKEDRVHVQAPTG